MNPRRAVALDRTVGPLVYRLHACLYRATGGRLGDRSPLGPIVVLTTTGRRSGRRRDVLLLAMVDGDDLVVVASNAGRDAPPAWLHNVVADPEVTVRKGRLQRAVRARIVARDEDPELFARLDAFYPGWAHYQTLTDRPIPAVLLSGRVPGPGTDRARSGLETTRAATEVS